MKQEDITLTYGTPVILFIVLCTILGIVAFKAPVPRFEP